MIPQGSDDSPAREQAKNEHDNGDNEEDVNEPSANVESEAEQPENDENNDNGFKHVLFRLT